MNQVELTFIGAVLDLKIELEGQEVGLYFDGSSKWARTLEALEIEEELDLVMLCKGVNGTKWSLEIEVDDNEPSQYSGEIKKGYALLSDKIVIPPKS